MACPICKRPTERAYRPFCSRRCADIDLGRWVTGAYTVPAEESDEWNEDSQTPKPDDE